jgi:hypothetical protein
MNLKLLLGIFLPLVLLISLVLLSSSNIGFLIETDTIESVYFDSIFVKEAELENKVLVRTIIVSNNFFLPKRYELPKFLACLNNKEGNIRIPDLQVKYYEGTYTKESETPIFNEISLYDYYYYGSNDYYYKSNSIELPTYSKKQIRIFIEPKDYEYYDNGIKEYDEILLIQSEKPYCHEINSKEMISATHIDIIA